MKKAFEIIESLLLVAGAGFESAFVGLLVRPRRTCSHAAFVPKVRLWRAEGPLLADYESNKSCSHVRPAEDFSHFSRFMASARDS